MPDERAPGWVTMECLSPVSGVSTPAACWPQSGAPPRADLVGAGGRNRTDLLLMGARPVLGTRYWFGPKRGSGWGWRPITWQGWLVTALDLAATVLVSTILKGTTRLEAVLGVVAALVAVCLLTGTDPGSAGDWPDSGRRQLPHPDEDPHLDEVSHRLEAYEKDHPTQSG